MTWRNNDDADKPKRGGGTDRGEGAQGGGGVDPWDDASEGREEPAYKVGKGKPPLHTRFKKGEPSANEAGRPRKDRSAEGFKKEALTRKIELQDERGRPIVMTTAQAIIEAQVSKAAQGNQAAIDKVFPWIQALFPAQLSKSVAQLDDISRAILLDQAAILKLISEAETKTP